MDEAEVRQFGSLFSEFLERVVHTSRGTPEGTESLVARLESFFESDPLALPVVTERFRTFEHATVQVAIDRLLERPGTRHELLGIAGAGREHSSLTELLEMGRRHGAFWVGAVDYAAVPVSVDEERTCVRFGFYLIDDGRRRLAVMLRGGNPMHGQAASLEVLAPTSEEGRLWLADLRELRARHNVLRGQVLSFQPSEFEPGVGPVRFHRRPDLGRDDVVMPPGVLERIERHVVGIAQHRHRLLAEGRHLKRGVLLYGPPGTGKTHTVRFLSGALSEFTVILLAGPAIRFVAEACAMARILQPSLIVLEDCDLVAQDRSFSPFDNPLLFTVLDEMDGLGSDTDVCFLLTTNRADLIETALAQRPGRVDLAVEIPLPDADGRRRLLDLYGRGIELTAADVEQVVALTAGVPASFVKEMTRRATLLAAERGAEATQAEDVHAAAEELMTAQEHLTRRLLGTGPSDDDRPAGGEPAVVGAPVGEGDAVVGHGGRGWFAYAPIPPRRGRYHGGGFDS
ncbi:MAG: AAA family ATPase [Jiangellaceae bacterium]